MKRYPKGVALVMDYWDTGGNIRHDANPVEEYEKYLDIYMCADKPLTLKDFKDYIEYLKDMERELENGK